MHYLDGDRVSDVALAALALPNYGCLTTMAVDGGRVRGLGMHLDRLRRDTAALFGPASAAVP
nr:hypothetical protein [Micromonospora sp. DSM 115978]